MRRVFASSDPITLYGGRKGFIELMKRYGQTFEHISAWLGHASVTTTYQAYYNRQKPSWTKKAA
jgi:integrase